MTGTGVANTHGARLGRYPLLHSGGYWRTALFFIVNVLLFLAINASWQFMASGSLTDFRQEAYYSDLSQPLSEVWLHPLSVVSHPWMIVVAGLLLAAMIAMPILTAVLYRLVFSLVLCLVVAAVGHAPVLALALAIGCVIAARTPLRSDMPFLASVLALVPVGLYLYLFGFSDSQAAEVLPLQRWVLASPLLLAMAAAILAIACVLGGVKLTRYRPGVVWPAAAILFIAPMSIFYTQIGPDELEYALIVRSLAIGDIIFRPTRIDTWSRKHGAEGLNRQTLNMRLRDELQPLRQELSGQCRDFLAHHGASPRAAEVLWIQAQCRSLQLDVPSFLAGMVRYSASFPSTRSMGLWQRLREDYPASPQAALADWRLGQLAVRRQELHEADARLNAAAEGLDRFLTPRSQSAEALSDAMVFKPAESIPPRGYYAESLFRVRRLIWLIQRNDAINDPAAAEALSAMLDENPLEVEYEQRLGRLASLYEKTAMGDNLKLAVATATASPYDQAKMLVWLAQDERTDAAVEANYQLGMLVMQIVRARALVLIPKVKKPQDYFRTVIAAPPNPWQELAAEHLARMAGQPEATEQPSGT